MLEQTTKTISPIQIMEAPKLKNALTSVTAMCQCHTIILFLDCNFNVK